MIAAEELTTEQREMVAAVREFVEKDVIPTASALEHADEFPTELVETMKKMGLFGISIPEEWGGLGIDLTTYALITAELCRGWVSLSGVLNTHFIAAWMIAAFGTDEQKRRYLPKMAKGELRSAFSMSEPHAGSDVQAIRTLAVRDGDEFVINGTKMWVTNGLRGDMIMLLVKNDLNAVPRHTGMTAFVVEKPPGVHDLPGMHISAPIKKLGYKGVDTVEIVFDGYRLPASAVLGGDTQVGQGFRQCMAGIEFGRISQSGRGLGVAQAAFEHSIRYAQQREAFGKPIAQHQAIQLKLATMATKIEASRLLMMQAARKKDSGDRADLETGMSKLFTTETAQEVVTEAMRIYGGYGYSEEFPIERLYRESIVLCVGEGSNEIQQLIIARRLLEQHAL